MEGMIETKLNRKIAYGMLDPGLTEAREKLQLLKGTKSRFLIQLKNESKSGILHNCFFVLQNIPDTWRIKMDYDLVAAFIELNDYKKVRRRWEKIPLSWGKGKNLFE
jgi:hypothetical protein